MNDLREWLVSKLNDSVEIGGDDELILGFIRKLDAAPSATGEPDRPDWARQLPGAEIYDRDHGYDRSASLSAGHYVCTCGACSRHDAQQPSHTTSHRTQEE